MTKRITISIPDDVAERIESEPNASRFVADAVRARLQAEKTRELLSQSGYGDLPHGIVSEVEAELHRRLELGRHSTSATEASIQMRHSRGID